MEPLTHLQETLAIGWWVATGFCIVAYLVLDGADLGAGIFSMFVRGTGSRGENARGAIMQAMAGTWDANETWLIVAGGILFGSFPYAYGSVLSYLMVPLALVLWGILTRAVALEFRHLAEPFYRQFTDWAFGLSSLTVTFWGGVSVGAVLHGFPMAAAPGRIPAYAGGMWRFLTPFSIWTGVAAVVAVSLSGGLFIRARFEHGERIRVLARTWTEIMFYLALAAVPISVVFMAIEFPWARQAWFGHYIWAWALVPLLAIALTVLMRIAVNRDHDVLALFWLNMTIATMSAGLIGTLYPAIVPGTWTIDTAASRQISIFTFCLTIVFLLPVVIVYNWYQIWVFRARVNKLSSYHG